MALGRRFSLLARSALLFACIVGILAVPAAAEIVAQEIRVGRLLGDCEGEVDLLPLKTTFFFDDAASPPIPRLATGTKLTLERGEGTDARVERGPAGSGNLYSNYRSEIVETREFGSFQLDLTSYSDDAALTILHDSDVPTGRFTAVAPFGFELAARAPINPDEGDPRAVFGSDPSAPRLSAALDDIEFGGTLRILVEQATFSLETDGRTEEFRAEDSYVMKSGAVAKQALYYILTVEDARVEAHGMPIATHVFADVAHVFCQGSVHDGGASDRTDGIAQSPLIASGSLDLESSLASQDTLLVKYTVGEAATSEPASVTIGVAESAFPYWGIVAALGLVGAGGTAAAWRHHRPVVGKLPEKTVAPKPAEITKAPKTPRAIPELEVAYRQDPSNIVVALELGLAYARKNQPHDALPLLQLAIQAYPKMDAARYFAGLALLELGRIDEGLRHLSYAFRLNALNVARFINEGAALKHGQHPRVRALLANWSRQFQESNTRGYV